MENVQTYFLDISTLVTILGQQKRSGLIQSDAVRIRGVHKNALVSLVMVKGVIQSCSIMQKQQKILEGKQAYSVILTLPALEWQWQPLAVSLPSFSAEYEQDNLDNEVLYPQQTNRVVDDSVLLQLSRHQRRVLSLCDGTRSVERLATMLSVSPPNLFDTIRVLKQKGLIRFIRPKEL